MKEFSLQLKEYTALAEDALPGFLPQAEPAAKPLADAMAYSLLCGGKRVRAVLLLAFCALFGGDVHAALPFAAAVEMLHAYSLIHDDLPCMDDDDLRRGKPACHIAFGYATALLAGDALQTLAFETLCRPENSTHFGAEKTLAAVRCLAVAAGVQGMAGGQMMDLVGEGKTADAATLRQTDEKKTGALIACAVEIGCILGGAGARQTAHAVAYASKLGIAFQVVDDILDKTADGQQLGKPVGSDEKSGKSTYVLLYGIEKSRQIAGELTDAANSELLQIGGDTSFLRALADMLTSRKF